VDAVTDDRADDSSDPSGTGPAEPDAGPAADRGAPGVDLDGSGPQLQGGITMRLESLVAQPWPVQRARWARLVLLLLVIAAPVTATALTWWGITSQADREIIAPDRGAPDSAELWIDATALTFDAEVGEMALRLVFSPRGELVKGDRLTDTVTLVLNDQAGRDIRTYPAGSVMEPITAVVAFRGDSVRYPFDTYDGRFQIGANQGPNDDFEPLTLDIALTAALDEFATSADLESTDNAADIDLELSRRWASIIWVLFFMFICWTIALGCAGMMWWVVVFHAEIPFWSFALFASVLFALPTLRNGLPGRPRYGVLVDWAAFYWAIAIVALGLTLALIVWNVAAHRTVLGSRRPGDD
jgi:hypothetical protein